jgi:hypothetical protein
MLKSLMLKGGRVHLMYPLKRLEKNGLKNTKDTVIGDLDFLSTPSILLSRILKWLCIYGYYLDKIVTNIVNIWWYFVFHN